MPLATSIPITRRAILSASVGLCGCGFDLESQEVAKRYPPARFDVPTVPVFAPLVARSGPWSGDNQLGYQAPYGPNKRATQTILKLDEWGPPEVWTVSLYLISPPGFNGFGIKARINFGAGGSTQVYEMDWANGAQVSLPMNACNVEAIFENVDVTTEGNGIQLGVQLARGTRGGNNPPIYTISDNFTLAAGGNELFALPNYARSIYAVPAEITAADIALFYTGDLRVTLQSGIGIGAFPTGGISGLQLAQGVRLPVTRQSRIIGVINGTASQLTFALLAELDG